MSTSLHAPSHTASSAASGLVTGLDESVALRTLLDGTVSSDHLRLAEGVLAGSRNIQELVSDSSRDLRTWWNELMHTIRVLRDQRKELSSWDMDFIAKLRNTGRPSDAAEADAIVADSIAG